MKTYGDTRPGYPEEPMYEQPGGVPDYKSIWKRVKTLDSGGKNVQTSWVGKTLTTADLKKIYKGQGGSGE